MNVEVNSNGVNKSIKYNILSDEEMRAIGFTDYAEDTWYFCRMIKFPKGHHGLDISFNVSIPKDNSDIDIMVLDMDFCQIYDYQHLLNNNV